MIVRARAIQAAGPAASGRGSDVRPRARRYDLAPMADAPTWTRILFDLAAGFVLLAKGADWLVDGSTRIARRIGISTLIIGLTVVAFGTSAPEIVVSSVAAWEGWVEVSLGNVLGSNIANIGLVLGASALVLPGILEAKLRWRELLWMLGTLAFLWILAADHAITRFDAALLLAAFLIYNGMLLFAARAEARQSAGEERPKEGWGKGGIWVLVGLIAIGVGANLVLDGSIGGAHRLGVPESVIGLTVVAVGTSLPELAAGLGGAMKGETDISLGNVVGSNVFNLMGVMGIVGMLQPLDASEPSVKNPAGLEAAFELALREDFVMVAVFSVTAVLLPRLFRGGGRVKGGLLLAGYAAYTLWLFTSR